MPYRAIISVLATLAIVSGCSRAVPGSRSCLLNVVPSDAVAVLSSDRCDDGLAMVLDSLHVFRSIDFGSLRSSHMVLSVNNVGSLEELAAIDAGRSSNDTSSAARRVLQQAAELGISARMITHRDSLLDRNVLVLSTSETVLTLSGRHLDAGTSILDAPGFDAVLESGLDNSLAMRNNSSFKFVTRALAPLRRTRSFFRQFADWTVISCSDRSSGEASFSCRAVCGSDPRYLANMITALPVAKSRLDGMVPRTCVHVVDLPLKDWRAYSSVYNGFLDSVHRLGNQSAAKTYMASLNPQELALLEGDWGSVLLVRPARVRNAAAGPELQLHVANLFGSVFAVSETDRVETVGTWIVSGREDSVDAYLAAVDAGTIKWTLSPVSCSYREVCKGRVYEFACGSHGFEMKTY